MTTNTIIPVRVTCDFDKLFVEAKTDNTCEALFNVILRNYQVPFMLQIASEIEAKADDDSYIPDMDDVLGWVDSKYTDYMKACDKWAATIGFEDYDHNPTIEATVMYDFDQIRRRLRAMTDKTAFELIRVTRTHNTKEKLMRLIADRIEPNTTATMDDIANIVISISDKYLGNRIGWF